MENHGSDDASVQRIGASPQHSTRCCIYRVPNLFRQENEQEYTPLLVSIGPLHHRKDDRFLPMEDHKLKYLESFLHDSQDNANLPSYIEIVKSMEAEIRECYADPIDISSDDFTHMILIDSVFLIEYLRRICQIVSSKGDEYIFGSQHLSPKVIRDIRLAENQIPFFVVLNLYERAFKPNTNTISNTSVPYFTDIVCRGLGLNRTKINAHVNDSTNEAICLHLLDLSRSHYKPLGMTRDDVMNVATINKSLAPFTATSLHEAGVKFQVTSSSDSEIFSSDLLNIGFDAKKGILFIPKLLLMDTTEYKWRNLLAFEQCHYYDKGDAYFSDYIAFLNGLINTCDDVRLLDWAGIIDNYLGSNLNASDFILAVGDNLSISVPHNYTGATHLLNGICYKRGVLDYRMWQYEICKCNDSPHFHV